MRIVAESQAENDILKTVSAFIKKKGYSTRINHYEDSFSLVVWSLDDINSDEILDERVNELSDDEKIDFLEFAERQLHEDMIERGWESLACQFDIYMTRKKDDLSGASRVGGAA